jgi:pyruvate dehydrogenase E1 component alpha subunit
LIEALTYRHRGHSRTDPATYRPEGELERWLERDPIVLFERVLVDRGVATGDELSTVRKDVEREIQRISEDVRGWPDPEPASRFEDVFV